MMHLRVSLAMALCAALSCMAPAHAAPDRNIRDTVRYFEYWSSYGDAMAAPEGRTRTSYSFSGGRISIFFTQDGVSKSFAHAVDKEAMASPLSDLLAGLDLSGWKTPVSEDVYGKLGDKKKQELCRWRFVALFEPVAAGQPGRELKMEGADDGDNPSRLAAERQMFAFFGPLLGRLTAETPKSIDHVYWDMPAAKGRVFYSVSRSEEDRTELSVSSGGKRRSLFVDAGLLGELQELVRKADADSWHGHGRGLGYANKSYASIAMKYDTLQEVYAMTRTDGSDSLPGFAELTAGLAGACDARIAADEAHPPRPDGLKKFRFAQQGMRAGVDPGYGIYRRVGKNGPVTILRCEHGFGNVTETIMSEEDLIRFEKLLMELGVASWDGFSGNARNVLDGTSFSFAAEYWNGKEISAGGYMRFPKGYREKADAIAAFLDAAAEAGKGPGK